jgi:hypothetical protein
MDDNEINYRVNALFSELSADDMEDLLLQLPDGLAPADLNFVLATYHWVKNRRLEEAEVAGRA